MDQQQIAIPIRFWPESLSKTESTDHLDFISFRAPVPELLAQALRAGRIPITCYLIFERLIK